MKTSFADVNDIKDTWTVHAKVLRKWVVRRKTSPYAVWKIGMILVDEEVDVNLYYDFNVLFCLLFVLSLCNVGIVTLRGLVYKFQNFQVIENGDKYRVTTHQWRFNFHTYTYVEESDVDISDEAYNFKSIADIQKRNVTDGGLIDVIGFLQAFGRLQDQRREFDIIKRLNFSIADENENLININLWGDCAEETYAKKLEDMEPPIIVLVRFARLNRNAEYGHLSNAFNATLVTLNPKIKEANLLKERLSQDSVGSQLFTQISNVENPTYSSQSLLTFRTRISLAEIAKIDEECDFVTKVTIQKVETLYGWSYDACPCDKKPEYMANGTLRCSKCDKDVLMTVPKYKIHYKVYDDTGKCSIIFFDRHATKLLGKSAAKIKEDMIKEGRNSTVPEELDEVAGKVAIVKLRIKSHNIKHRTSSIAVTQFCGDTHLIEQFQYSNLEVQGGDVVEESTDSKDSVAIAVEDDDNSLSQLITPTDNNTKRKKLTGDSINICEDFGLSELSTPVMLIRNIDQAAGLCNGTRLQVTQLGKNVIRAKALNDISAGEDILIHRMDMNPSESKLPFNMTRRQFPIIISFAMTINKSQCQSMSHVGLYLPSSVFSHGQLYVALSRVKIFNGLRVLILDEAKKASRTTINVVYREVFQNLQIR
ncbi:hypothetical protein K1719_030774 [Acacia pycnantha]|nr:hypothetical protein K1719_030774 [Acacia pycnantha]